MGCLKGVLLLLCFMQMYNGCDRKTRLFNNSLSRIIPTADVNVLLKGVLAGVCVFRGKKKKKLLIWPAQASTFTNLVYLNLARSLQLSRFFFLLLS